MQIKELKSTDLEKEFQITIPSKDINEKLNNKLLEISETSEVEGFRKGKVPIDILKQKFGESALGQILDDVIRVSSNEIISKNNLKLAMKPKVDVKKFGEDKGLEYVMSLELIPNITVQDPKKIKLVKYVSLVNEDDLNKTLENIAKHQQNFEKKDNKKAEIGDAVLLNMKPTYADKIVKEAEINSKLTVLGNNMILPDIEKRILNSKTGDKLNFTTKFPKNFMNKEIAEKDVKVEIEILEVRVAKEKIIDDEFAKTMGAKDLQDFKKTIKDQMQKEIDNVSKTNLKKNLLDQLDKMYVIKLPKGLVDYEFDNIWKKFLDDKKKGQEDPSDKNKKEEDLKKEYKSIAERRVKLGLILAKVGEDKKIVVNDDEVQKALEEEILRQPAAKDQILSFYKKNPQALASLKAPIFEEKVVENILKTITIEEKTVSRKELFKKQI